ncbi:RNase MRP subunit [Pleosporales sp. CAS-2024a]
MATNNTSTITAAALIMAAPHDQAMLRDVHTLLDKIFVRNMNQHHRSLWWKSLHAFRKQLDLLLQELEGNKDEGKLGARLRYWDEKFIHQWYYQLVAVGPFAMLGIVMMASIARVCRICGITAVYEEIASGDIQGVLSANDDLALAHEFAGVLDEEETWGEDEGVVVEREEHEDE